MARISDTVEVVMDAVRTQERDLSRRLPPEWVAANGPRVAHLKDGMVVIHQGWEGLRPFFDALMHKIRSPDDLPEVYACLVGLSASTMKLAIDCRSVMDANEVRRLAAVGVPCAAATPVAVPAGTVDDDFDDEAE